MFPNATNLGYCRVKFDSIADLQMLIDKVLLSDKWTGIENGVPRNYLWHVAFDHVKLGLYDPAAFILAVTKAIKFERHCRILPDLFNYVEFCFKFCRVSEELRAPLLAELELAMNRDPKSALAVLMRDAWVNLCGP